MIASRTSSDHADARPCSESQPQAEGITNAPPSDPTTTQDPDVEAAGSMPAGSLAPAPIPAAAPAPALDIEHQLVDHDLQLWSSHQKAICVATLMLGALSPTLGASISLPALQSTQVQLNAFNATISLAVSLCILFQGTVPLFWPSISELIGRKSIFIAGSIIFAVTSLICGLSSSVGVFVTMRCISAIGSSPMLSKRPVQSSPFNKPEGSFDTEVTSGKPTLTPGSHRPCRPKGQEQSEFNNFTYVGRLLHRISFVSLCRLCK
ncbi:unnamed protein product [Tilletia controversa]|nr:unnamed protein product [Tilletia controversa]